MYVAPLTVNTPQSATVTATSSQDPTKTASATIVLVNSPGGGTPTGSGCHAVTLNWGGSPSTVAGYNVFRSATSGGPYTQVNSSLIAATSWEDDYVLAGEFYYYVAVAVDSSGNTSLPTSEAPVTIPTP